jgi:hypothetical protein
VRKTRENESDELSVSFTGDEQVYMAAFRT